MELLYSQATFNKAYRNPTTEATVFTNLCVTDSVYYTFGLTVKNSINVGFFSKIRLDGQVELFKIIGDSLNQYNTWNEFYTLRNMKATIDGSFILVGNHLDKRTFLLKLSQDGNILLTTSFSPQDTTHKYIFNNIIEADSGGYYIIGQENSVIYPYTFSQAKLFRLSENGTIIWSKNFSYPNWYMGGISIIQKENNLYLLVSKYQANPDENSYKQESILIKTDTSGNILCSYSLSSSRRIRCIDFALLENKNIVIGAAEHFFSGIGYNNQEGYVTVIDSSFSSQIWEKNIGHEVRQVEVKSNKNILVATSDLANINGVERPVTSIYEINSLGDSIHQAFYNSLTVQSVGTETTIHAFSQTPDGSLIVCGQVMDGYYLSPTVGYWGWLMRTDANGNAPGQVTGIAAGEKLATNMLISPNPAQDEVTFTYQGASKSAEIQITDLTGKSVAVLEIRDKTIWNVAEQASGMYFYSLVQSGRVLETGKFIIQK